MREHRLAARGVDPADRLAAASPTRARRSPGLPGARKRLKTSLHLARVPVLDQEAREVRARDRAARSSRSCARLPTRRGCRLARALARCAARARRAAADRLRARRRGSRCAGSMRSATTWIVRALPAHRSSAPQTNVKRGVLAPLRWASARPAMSSWSVSASTSTPRATAARRRAPRASAGRRSGSNGNEVVATHAIPATIGVDCNRVAMIRCRRSRRAIWSRRARGA